MTKNGKNRTLLEGGEKRGVHKQKRGVIANSPPDFDFRFHYECGFEARRSILLSYGRGVNNQTLRSLMRERYSSPNLIAK